MWILLTRAPAPDAMVWPGRRPLAVLDAITWPAAWIAIVEQAGFLHGIVGAALVTWGAVAAWGRVRSALWVNHRYRFTTWRWGRVVGMLTVLAIALKWTLTRSL